ncbi:hypothetical protein LTR64_002893 [Lithohypha guttulata]|uniref:uncharacterized protein n=1 Tax=Lithohypha guttulata TaxID=1690604 RepID=UPI002DDE1B67|nr:hypothetical protein LTR51_000882 [Lithohypha guttulata]
MASGSSAPVSIGKRRREVDEAAATPNKRRLISDEKQQEEKPTLEDKAVKTGARKSRTSLQQTKGTQVTPNENQRHGNTGNQHESSHASPVEAPEHRQKPRAKKILKRFKQIKTQTASPFQGQGEVMLKKPTGAILTSNNTPAKTERGKRRRSLARLQRTNIWDLPKTSAPPNEDLPDDELVEEADERSHSPEQELEDVDSGGEGYQDIADEETEDTGTDEEHESTVPKASQKPKGRPLLTEEEKRAKKKAIAKQQQENLEETEAARLIELGKHCERFMRGIGDSVWHLGGQDCWSKMGGAANMITSMVAPNKDMGTERSRAVWEHLEELSRIFLGKEGVEPTTIDNILQRLDKSTTRSTLMEVQPSAPGDRTVVDTFEYLIPRSVQVLKHALRGSLQLHSKRSLKQLQSLVDISRRLCNTARGWRPKPSTLEGGIRRHVRNDIQPNLRKISHFVNNHLRVLADAALRKQELRQLEKEQLRAKAEMRRLKEEIRMRMVSQHVTSNSHSRSAHMDAEDIDEILDDEPSEPIPQSTTMPQGQASQGTFVHNSEQWTEEEEKALLGGLQTFQAGDRYVRIRSMCPTLSSKSIDQCKARAQYYRRMCRAKLEQHAADGDHRFDWLELV